MWAGMTNMLYMHDLLCNKRLQIKQLQLQLSPDGPGQLRARALGSSSLLCFSHHPFKSIQPDVTMQLQFVYRLLGSRDNAIFVHCWWPLLLLSLLYVVFLLSLYLYAFLYTIHSCLPKPNFFHDNNVKLTKCLHSFKG